MKLRVIFFILATASSVLASIDRPFFVGLGLLKSRIPRFITSLQHPYIQEHQHAIEALSDPTRAFCHSDSQLRALLPPIPHDMFKKMSLNDKKWAHTVDVLTGVLDCPLAMETLEELQVEVSLSPLGDTEPPAKVFPLFTRLLNEALQLKTLAWMDTWPKWTPGSKTSALHKYLSEQKLYLPGVTTMVLGPNVEFFVSAAPKLQKISSAPGYAWTLSGFRSFSHDENGPQRRLIRSLDSAKELKEVGLDVLWSLESIVELQKAAPGIRTLTLRGYLDDEGRQYGPEGRENFKAILSQLATLESLTTLGLPHVRSLGIGSWPEPHFKCGNAYFGLNGVKWGRVEDLQDIRDTERAVTVVIESIPQLTEVCIWDCADVKEGKAVNWPWSGRLREYILELWPRLDGTSSIEEDRVKEDPNGPVLNSWQEDEEWFPTAKEHQIDEL